MYYLLEKKSPPLDLVCIFYQKYPEAIKHQDSNQQNPLHVAYVSPVSSVDVIEFLISKYPEGVKSKGRWGYLPLHYACCRRAPLDVIELLVESFPESIHEQENYGHTPLHEAKLYNAPQDVISFLQCMQFPFAKQTKEIKKLNEFAEQNKNDTIQLTQIVQENNNKWNQSNNEMKWFISQSFE